MKSEDIRISVALVTRNRPASLERCLQSWRAQVIPPAEIIVSDDSDELNAPAIAELARRYDGIYTRGPRRGLYANRNHASLACTGTHILSADDDHTHPTDYLKQVLSVVRAHPERVWIFAERSPDALSAPINCPPELHRSGFGCSPRNPDDCAAIADGSSVYPREIFDSGLRYDDSYPFGTMWYLWGRVLVKNKWRISFSDATYVIHHIENGGRETNVSVLHNQMLCVMYVTLVNSLWVNSNPVSVATSFGYLFRRMLRTDSIVGYQVRTRLRLPSVAELMIKVWKARLKYQSMGMPRAAKQI
jgi:glycosyltransferase involved in cell wall biosynthesis